MERLADRSELRLPLPGFPEAAMAAASSSAPECRRLRKDRKETTISKVKKVVAIRSAIMNFVYVAEMLYSW